MREVQFPHFVERRDVLDAVQEMGTCAGHGCARLGLWLGAQEDIDAEGFRQGVYVDRGLLRLEGLCAQMQIADFGTLVDSELRVRQVGGVADELGSGSVHP